MKESKSAKDYHVTRISKELYDAIRTLGPKIVMPGGKKKRPSLNEILEALIITAETVIDAEPFYLVGHEVFDNLETARGEAVMAAARHKEQVLWPRIAIVIGEDAV